MYVIVCECGSVHICVGLVTLSYSYFVDSSTCVHAERQECAVAEEFSRACEITQPAATFVMLGLYSEYPHYALTCICTYSSSAVQLLSCLCVSRYRRTHAEKAGGFTGILSFTNICF